MKVRNKNVSIAIAMLFLAATFVGLMSLSSCTDKENVADVATESVDPQALEISLDPCLNFKNTPELISVLSWAKNEVHVAGNFQTRAAANLGATAGAQGKWNILHPTQGVKAMNVFIHQNVDDLKNVQSANDDPREGDMRGFVNAKCANMHTEFQACTNRTSWFAIWKTCVRDECWDGDCVETYTWAGTKFYYSDDACSDLDSTSNILKWTCL